MGSKQKKAEKKNVRDYLDQLVWDKQPRLNRWLVDYAGATDTPYVRAVSRTVLVAAVRRVRQPGCAFDKMLILEGPQGIGKSMALRILAVDDTWHGADLPLSDTRRLLELTAGKWIIEASELRTLSYGDVAALKACLSSPIDEARMPYALETTRVPRQFVVVGTTTTTEYLSGATGNRRFWPVQVTRVDFERLRADRDQLWAEAVVIEAAGESLRELITRVDHAQALDGGASS